ncbi:MAG TPA: F0F1 ATP synthase subunit delta [Acidimicrobiales bacterium]|nr:F0F1 ATP synthase subunit delta [Acidimicrobiales bacterium]
MNPTLQGYSAAVAEAAGRAALRAIAADLEEIEQLVLGNMPLRAALSDTSISGAARRAVMLDLLEGKVAPEARRLAAYACMAVGAPEVAGALGWLATRVRHLSEGEDEEPSLSLTQSRERVGGYATAVHEDMSSTELESLEDDLFRFARIVASTPPLRAALTDRDLGVGARQGLVTQLLSGKVPATSERLARYAVTGGRARDIVGTLDFLVELTAKARGWRIARVRAAAPIDDAQRSELSDSLATLAGQPVELQVEVDESLLGGALIQIGDLQVDATARGRIDALREHITPAGWEPAGFGRRGQSSEETEGAN